MKLSFAYSYLVLSYLRTADAFTINHSKGTSLIHKSSPTALFGILDEIKSDSYNLFDNKAKASSDSSSDLDQAYDTFLAQLVFSTKDPRLQVMENFDLASDDNWINWLQKKIDKSRDVEEKMALKDLKDMIIDIKKRVELSRLAEEREMEERKQQQEAEALVGTEKVNLSNADILRKAKGIATGQTITDDNLGQGKSASKNNNAPSFLDADLTPEIRMSYDDLLKKVLPPYKQGDTVESVVFSNYEQMDAQFIKVLTERANNGDLDSESVLTALGKEQSKRIANATDNIRAVLSMGDPGRMEGMVVKLARDGKIDEPFLLLLEANIKQAEQAGAVGPAKIMRRLASRASEEKDKQSATKEIKLLRKLLRTDDSKEREALLEDAFTPKDKFLVEGTTANAAKAADGEQPEQAKPVPDVPPPDFINACKAVLLNFGNIVTDDGRGDLASRIKTIAAEAEAVATKIYGKGMSVREQQDRMWAEQTTSIFDLETLEIEAERRGEKAPWAKDADDNDIIPGFDRDGRMQIGGR